MKWIRFDREEPMNLDASSSQELKRVVVARQADEELTSSHIIPDALLRSVRPETACRELLSQPFGDWPQ
ncbi:MAG: hypothetical protein AB7U20_21710 [Planctomycetaceae bacterium]